MEKLWSVAEIAERYHIKERTAREWMREMGALKIKPMMVPESAVEAWERKKSEPAEEETTPTIKHRKKKNPLTVFPTPVPPKPGQYISRVRPKNIGNAV